MKNTLVFLKGKKTTLRPILESDIPLLMKWINDPEVRRFVKRVFPAMESDERDWIKRLHDKSGSDIAIMIEVKGKPIGTMGIHGINWKDRTATTGALIGEKNYWGKGYGTDAKMVLLDYAFNVLNLRKIMSRVFAFNYRSLRYSLHCGYKIEGRLKRQRFSEGRYWDEIILGLFKSDWLPYWEKYQKK
ncbi:MAG: GNAT family N-acetyltransferase [Patescibacteria group bacterium]|nr:GNAT family N-acetyltransferase [Patescibacteria group bacterium]